MRHQRHSPAGLILSPGNPTPQQGRRLRASTYTIFIMKLLEEFEISARENGFLAIESSADGSTTWFRKELPDAATDAHRRLCVDQLTSSVTVFWATLPWKINSKTFRTIASLKAWFALVAAEAA